MAGATAARIARARRRIATYFITAGATRADAPVAYNTPAHPIERRVFERMVAFGALQETSPGKYWLHEARYADFRKERLANVLGAIALAGFAAAGALALG